MLLAVGIICGPTAIALHEWPTATAYVATSEFCVDCHADPGGDLGGHASVDCRSCHAVPADEMPAQVLATLGGPMPAHGAVIEASCARCHSERFGRWNMLMQAEGHASHVEAPVSIECVRCHRSSLHGRPSAAERCEACHESTAASAERGAALECGTCHTFGEADRRRPPGAWGAGITVADVHGAADCRLCHDPHRGYAPRGQACETCHRGSLARSSAVAPEGHRACEVCHRMHGPRDQVAAACAVCHRAPRVRGDRRDPGVPPERAELASAVPILESATGPTPRADVAHEARCGTCHVPHGWEPPDEAACGECHEEQATPLARAPTATHTCLGCHEPHSRTAESCSSCHDRDAAVGPASHPACLTCHDPHEGAPITGGSCVERCHDEERAQLAEGPPQHARCTTCHLSHAGEGADTHARCATCHPLEARQFPQRVSCDDCHPAHRFAAEPAAEAVHRSTASRARRR